MTKKVPYKLPDCELVRRLAEKAGQRRDIDFNFVGRLDEFRRRVSQEVRYINQLFPEYTPHDEQYHLTRLFHVADTILGRDRLETMNSAELFILAVALYGHDWGMAVSDVEKEYIVTGKSPEGANLSDLWILRDEGDRLRKFAREQRLRVDAEGRLTQITIEVWREYVRQTHALRSGERVRRFFEPIDGGVAEAASRVCLGHWLDFQDLQDYRSYPPDFSALRQTVNLRALAVYLRLIDLLDLAEDRTPYVIWKFVAPRDPRSKMEWAKHRALQAVTCPPYQQGRVIQVDGSTDDHDVYAALEDLRVWCEDQLRECSDLLARMNDPRHKLDLYHIDWRVAPRGFKPVSVQFEFERNRMFEILSDEIYQGDPYVFLRELLQNSIDAIRMRREVLQRKGIDPGNLGVIEVTVEHGARGDAVLTWRDDGIGMDEYILRNYLAVAGQSYYHSADFEREGLKMDPISRFGIGILSCFIVADRVEIETFKDPYLPPRGEPLKIVIPAMRRQFRIEVRTEEAAIFGTTVRVFVEGRKIPVEDGGHPSKPLDVTSYLSVVAGFVEFPIVINEGDRKTIVLHPNQAPEVARRRFGEGFVVHQVDLGYPWPEAILPQDPRTAREVLREECFDISSDLRLQGYEGTFTYLVPISREIDLRKSQSEAAEVLSSAQTEHVARRFRWHPEWHESYRSTDVTGVSRSGSVAATYAVYRDGILLPAASPPPFLLRLFREQVLPPPRMVVNLPKSRAPKVDLGRTQLVGQAQHWASPVLQAHARHVSEAALEGLLALDPSERLYQLARLVAFHNIEARHLWEIFPHGRWPVPFLEAGGRLSVLELQKIPTGAVYLSPEILAPELTEMARCQWVAREEYTGSLLQWDGEPCVVSRWSWGGTGSAAIGKIEDLWQLPFEESHCLATVRFLHPPWEGDPPLIEEMLLPMERPEKHPDDEAILRKAVHDPTLLNPVERASVSQLLGRHPLLRRLFLLPKLIEFPPPFEQSFAYAHGWWNLKHPVTQAVLRCVAALLSTMQRTLPEARIGILRDHLEAIFQAAEALRWGLDPEVACERICDSLHHALSLAREMRLLDASKIEGLVLNPGDFVPGSVGKAAPALRGPHAMATGRLFGRPLI